MHDGVGLMLGPRRAILSCGRGIRCFLGIRIVGDVVSVVVESEAIVSLLPPASSLFLGQVNARNIVLLATLTRFFVVIVVFASNFLLLTIGACMGGVLILPRLTHGLRDCHTVLAGQETSE